MKIVHTPPRYAPHIGGVEAVDQILAEYSVRHGDDVLVFAADEPRGAPDLVNGVRLKRLPWKRKLANTNLTWQLPKQLWREPFDVVHTHLPTPWTADVSVLVARLRKRRSVLHFHNPIVGDGPAGLVARLYQVTLQRLTLALADAVIVISPTRQRLLVAQNPRIAAKTHLVPNGVDLSKFRPPEDTEDRSADLLFVSVLDDFHDYKGLSVLLRALRDVADVNLHVVGDGPKRPVWEQEARELGVDGRVRWCGAITDDELRTLYQTCGIFTLPSQTADHEGGSSLVALEAMASGMPVVLADGVGDLAAEAAAAGAGRHVPSSDHVALADALRGFAEDAEGRRKAGRLAREHVEAHHSWEAACARITALYVS